jgi:hypothetical protein
LRSYVASLLSRASEWLTPPLTKDFGNNKKKSTKRAKLIQTESEALKMPSFQIVSKNYAFAIAI